MAIATRPSRGARAFADAGPRSSRQIAASPRASSPSSPAGASRRTTAPDGPLPGTPPGIFARLVLDVALERFPAPSPVLALLKHPFATLGLSRGEVRRATEALEIGALRGPRPPAGHRRARARRSPSAGPSLGARPRARVAPAPLRQRLDGRRRPCSTGWSRRSAPFAASLARGRGPAGRASSSRRIETPSRRSREGSPELYAQETGLALAVLPRRACSGPTPTTSRCRRSNIPACSRRSPPARTVRGGEPQASAHRHLRAAGGAAPRPRQARPRRPRRRHLAGRRARPIPGSTGRCARRSACRRRKSGSASRPMTSRRRSAARRRRRHARPQARRLADRRLALAAAPQGLPRRGLRGHGCRAGAAIGQLARALDAPHGSGRRAGGAAAPPAARAAADPRCR